jgi:hypothetical protein
MSKFAKLTVRVPVDDALHIGQLRDHLRDVLEERGIETLDLKPPEPNGETESMLPDSPRKGRVYWPAAEVVLGVERPPPPPEKPARSTRSTRGH